MDWSHAEHQRFEGKNRKQLEKLCKSFQETVQKALNHKRSDEHIDILTDLGALDADPYEGLDGLRYRLRRHKHFQISLALATRFHYGGKRARDLYSGLEYIYRQTSRLLSWYSFVDSSTNTRVIGNIDYANEGTEVRSFVATYASRFLSIIDIWRTHMFYCWQRCHRAPASFRDPSLPDFQLCLDIGDMNLKFAVARIYWLLQYSNNSLNVNADVGRYDPNHSIRLSTMLREMGPEYASQFDLNSLQLVSSSEWLTFLTLVDRATEWRLEGQKMSPYEGWIRALRRRAHPKNPQKLRLNFSEFSTEITEEEVTSMEEPQCFVCFSPFGTKGDGTKVDNTEAPVRLACGHAIGKGCFQEWVVGSGATTCPMCRKTVCSIAALLPPHLLTLFKEVVKTSKIVEQYDREIDILLLQRSRAPNDFRVLKLNQVMSENSAAITRFMDAMWDYVDEF